MTRRAPAPARLFLLALLIIAILAWRSTPAPAASNTAITPLFLGSLSGSATTAPSPADALFTTLASHATSSIDVAMYDFDRASVRDALIAAKNRGLGVRIVGDGADAADPQYAPFYSGLLSAGIPIVTDTLSSLMHNKFAVFDGQVTWTGSANFSNTAFTLNGENVLVITDTVVATAYRTEFDELFGGTFSTHKTDNTVHSATVGGAPIELAFAPTDGVQQRIVNAVNTANDGVQIAMFTFTNDALGDTLIAAHTRGVSVEVLLDGLSAGGVGGERDRLCAAGIIVRVENFSGKIHDKYAVVDAGTASDPLIVSGSTNWTASAVQANDENLLIVHDAGLASAYAADFARLRSAIVPGSFTCNVGSTPTAVQYLPVVQKPLPSPTPTDTPLATETPTMPPTGATLTPTGPTATPTSSPTATPTLPPPTFSNCQADPNPNAAPNYPVKIVSVDKVAEVVTLQNVSNSAVNLDGWHMCSITGNQEQQGIGGTLAPRETKGFTNPGGPIWNNSTSDPGALYNQSGQLVSYYPD